MGAPMVQQPAPLIASSWMLQVKGIPSASTNADMQIKAISMFHGTPFQFAFLHNDLSQPALNNARLPQQALLHFATLDGACSAQSCLWETAEHFKDEWFRTDAETRILERRAHVKQLDQPSQVNSHHMTEAGVVQHQGTMQSLLPVQAAIQEPMTYMSVPAPTVTTQNGSAADTRPGMQQPNLKDASSEPTSETTVKYCPGPEVSSEKLITEAASQQQSDLSEAPQASIQPPPPPPLHELAALSAAMADPPPPPLPLSEPPHSHHQRHPNANPHLNQQCRPYH